MRKEIYSELFSCFVKKYDYNLQVLNVSLGVLFTLSVCETF